MIAMKTYLIIVQNLKHLITEIGHYTLIIWHS